MVSAVLIAGLIRADSLTVPVDAQTVPMSLLETEIDSVRRAGDILLRQRYYDDDLRWQPLFAVGQGLGLGTLSVEMQVLDRARFSVTPQLRIVFVRMAGRFENPADVPVLLAYLGDGDRFVRREAANAIAQALHLPDAPGRSNAATLAFPALRNATLIEPDVTTAAVMWQALGELPLNDADLRQVEQTLVAAMHLTIPEPPGFATRQAGALRGLVEMLRANRSHQISKETREFLRKLALPGMGFKQETGPTPAAMEALVLARENDAGFIRSALTFRCLDRIDCGWEIRRYALQLVTTRTTALTSGLRAALSDPAFRVRIEALRVYARDPDVPKSCGVFLDALNDRVYHVILEALTLLDPECSEREQAVDRLKDIAADLSDVDKSIDWPIQIAALAALARFRPEAAKPLAHDLAMAHRRWEVRAEAAKLAIVLGDVEMARELMRDKEPNVRTEALQALYRLGSASTDSAIAESLGGTDHQLVYAAAYLLKLRGGASPTTRPGIVQSLDRITRASVEPPHDVSSRETRLELLARIRELGLSSDSELISQLRGMRTKEFDPLVSKAIAATLQAMTGKVEPPVPTVEVRNDWGAVSGGAPRAGCYRVELESGRWFNIVLNAADAPRAAEAFAAAQHRGYYDGLTFHRVNAMSFIEGGSPAANYFKGTGYLMDEPGLKRHTRGAVGLSRHDRHTGDLQFFINLVENPAFDRQFTVLGVVGKCISLDPPVEEMLDIIDRIRPGEVIRQIVAR
jgi:cyclophilin family peptidyl-prolyl cis-trans isomerase/HEAT repeat protein